MAKYPKQSPKKQDAFLAAYVECGGNITAARKSAQLNHNAHYAWLEHDPTYPERFAEAEFQATQKLLDEARHRALVGMRQYKFDRDGQPILHPETNKPYYEERRSDAILIRLLEAFLPELFARRTKVETKDTTETASIDELREVLAQLRQAHAHTDELRAEAVQRSALPRPDGGSGQPGQLADGAAPGTAGP